MTNTKRNQRCTQGKKQVTRQQLDHEIDSAAASAHAPRWTHPNTHNHCPFTQLVTLGPTIPNLKAVGGRPLRGTKLRLSAKERHIGPMQAIRFVNTRTTIRKHFGRAGQETKRSTQSEPQNATPVTSRRDQGLARQQHGPRNGPTYRCLVTHVGVRTNSTFRGTREDGVGGVKFETTRNTMEKLDRQQVTLDGRRPQFLSGKGLCNVLE